MQVCEFLWTHQWKYLTRLCRKDKRMDAHLNPELTNCQSLIIPGICFMRRCPLCSSLTAPNLLAPKAHWVGALNSIKLPHYVRMDWMDTSARLQPLACTLSPTYHAVINLAMLEKVFCCQNTYLILKVMVGGGGGGGNEDNSKQYQFITTCIKATGPAIRFIFSLQLHASVHKVYGLWVL